MENKFFSLKDVAELVRTPSYKIHYWLQNRLIPEPKLRIGGRRVWTQPEIVVVSEWAQQDKAAEPGRINGK